MSHQRPDPSIPQRQAADPQASVWVAASAGTGKTKVLTDRVLNLLLAGSAPERILCLTFTKAAAAEMANRIAQRLAGWATMGEAELDGTLATLVGQPVDQALRARARRLFAQVLDVPGGMKILTIHAFCQSLLRRFPLEAGLAPHFQVMDERDSTELLQAARDEVLQQARTGGALASALAQVTGHIGETEFPELLDALAGERGRLKRMRERPGTSLRQHLGLSDADTAASILASACDDTAFDGAACRAAVDMLRRGTATDGARADAIAAWLAAELAARNDGFDDYCRQFLTNGGDIRVRLATKACADALPALQAEAERLVAVLERWRAAKIAEATEALLEIAGALLAAYESHKAAHALLDYDDLILAAVGLLSGNHGAAAWVLFKLDGGIDHVLIDEAQDTNPDQWAVVRALTDEFFAGYGTRERIRTVFAVGDAKQSIYSFQGADPREFERMRTLLSEQVPAAGQRWRQVGLHVSFRSTAAVLDAVDAVFNRDPGRDGVVLDGEEIRHLPWREGQAGLVELWPPVTPRLQDEPEPWKPPVERVKGDNPRTRLARLVARRVHAMVGQEMLESQGRPVRAGDVMVLVRRRNAFVDDLVRELKALDVAVAGADRLVLTEQMAVMDLMALGHALLLPEDDLTLATVLKGPLFGLDEDQLFRLAHERSGSLWQALRHSEHVAQREFLAELLGLADRLPPHELFAHVLATRGGRLKLVRRLGWEAEDAIDEFMALTLAYERAHPPSLQGFLHWLESGSVEVKRDLDQGGHDAVRIMTVHGAKGLQAPIVFLPDTLQTPKQSPNLLWLGDGATEALAWLPRSELADPACMAAREAAQAARDQEYRRLLYVAMTRAEDRLYVCGWETRRAAPEHCWYDLIGAALRAQGVAEDDAFLAKQGETEASVLRLRCRQDVAVAAPPAAPVILTPAAWPDWIGRTAPDEPSPPRPLVPSRPEAEEPPVRSPLGPDDGHRFRRGVLIHRLLQTLPELPHGQRAAAAARYLARSGFGLAVAAQAELAAEVARVLEHPEFAPIFGPGSQAEVPVVGMVGERVVSGQVDRLLVTKAEVLVIDFKTNRPPPRDTADVPPVYLRQMAAYRAALACIYPGRAIRCALLWTDAPRLMPLEAARLDDILGDLRG